MTPQWSAEQVVSVDAARGMIEQQFPQLAPAQVEPLGAGWDNSAFRVNGAFVFRFPRRRIAVACMEAETRLLPLLAPRMPLAVPTPAFVGRPTEDYPWPFAGYPFLAGRTACSILLDDTQRGAAAVLLGHFLATLHGISTIEAAACGAPPDTIGRLDLGRYIPRARDILGRLGGIGLIRDCKPFTAILDAAPTACTPRTDVLVHGDLYARHLLVDAHSRLCGVIDWGDVHLGEPALDLAIAHTFLPPAAHPAFRRAYGPVNDAIWALARLRGLCHMLMVLAYGHEVGDADLVREGLAALAHLAAGMCKNAGASDS